ncbi:FliM/FliN family flagellar motor switch protein [Ideonella oryzae]|uniref:Flagellar motor switch protein FliN n=1 Tax=Ideonella oryzae TaxID=2937441 RepID=A0ABT1BMB5_9BURK|nr:FliM/FliN family flagellar motor switch protein [Ideonella oryzae]MCO5977059.1 FliM/FliN family flagellar motor switch protein [Ideonella oryzae]
MNANDKLEMDPMLGDGPDLIDVDMPEVAQAAASPAKPRRDLSQMMRRIPITLTLEVGSARVSLQDLAELSEASVVELDALAGEPLVIKANGTPVGRAEVVVSGDNYGLKVVEFSGLDLDRLQG